METIALPKKESLFFEHKLESVTAGLPRETFNLLQNKIPNEDALVIMDYVISVMTEVNPSDNYRIDIIKILSKFIIFCRIGCHLSKPLNQLGRKDVLAFLDSFRKPETSDPLHRWIGTYNLYRTHLLRFFKWLYSPNVESYIRPKPSVVENIPQLRRKEKSTYRPTDLWTFEDDLLFLKFCPSKRMKCFHTIARDTSCRPHELLKLRIRDITFKITPSKSQYAELLVNGKTGSRPLVLIDSIPYVKDYLDHEHPQPRNPNAIFISGHKKSLGRALDVRTIESIYRDYKTKLFPKLLQSSNTLPEDKMRIRELLKKPWNPYVLRHSSLTDKSKILKEHVLRQYAGWSIGSQMPQKYIHYFGNESSESLLEAYGIVPKGQQIDQLKPKQCPNCSEPNKPDSKFCAKCRMVLTYDAYSETLENQKEKEDRLTTIEKQYNTMQSMLERLVVGLSKTTNQQQFNALVQSLCSSGILKPADVEQTI